jgi:hypothetical protein
MTHLLQRFSNGELLALIAIIGGLYLPIVGGITVGIIKFAAAHFRRMELDDVEAALKLEMIQCGMSAEAIAQILEARLTAPLQGRVEISRESTRP